MDHQTIEMFEAKLTEHLNQSEIRLKDGTYRPQAVRRVTIPKPRSRHPRKSPPRIKSILYS